MVLHVTVKGLPVTRQRGRGGRGGAEEFMKWAVSEDKRRKRTIEYTLETRRN